MGGLARICKLYGGLDVKSGGKTVSYRWDYATNESVKAEEMPEGSERWKASEKAKWDAIRQQRDAEEGADFPNISKGIDLGRKPLEPGGREGSQPHS